MATFAELKGQVEALARRKLNPDATTHATLVGVTVNAGLHSIQDLHNWRVMKTTLTCTDTAVGSRTSALPALYKAEPHLYAVGSKVGALLTPFEQRIIIPMEADGDEVTPEWIWHYYPDLTATTETPLVAAIEGDHLLYNAKLSRILALELDCYGYLADLAEADDSNWFTVRLAEAVLWEAARWYHLMLHEPAMATQWHDATLERLNLAIGTDAEERATRQSQIITNPYNRPLWQGQRETTGGSLI